MEPDLSVSMRGAALHGHLRSLRQLLTSSGVSIDAADEDGSKAGYTALMCASCGGHDAAVRLLLDHGADIEVRKSCGEELTALLMAIDGDHAGCVKVLLTAGASTQPLVCGNAYYRKAGKPLAYEYHESPLLRAAQVGATASLAALLDHICGVSSTLSVTKLSTERGYGMRTPLMLAAGNGQSEAVELLLARGAWTHLTDLDGKTALNLAAAGGNFRCAALLRQHSAEPYDSVGPLPGFTLGAASQPHTTPIGSIHTSLASYGASGQQRARSGGGSSGRSLLRARARLLALSRQVVDDPEDFFANSVMFESDDEDEMEAVPVSPLKPAIFAFGAPDSSRTTAPAPVLGVDDTPSPTASKPAFQGVTLPPPPPPMAFTAAAAPAAAPAPPPPSYHVSFDSLILGDVLYDISHSVVHSSRWMGADVAVRQVKAHAATRRAASAAAAAATAAFLEDAQTLATLQHPNLVAFLGVCAPEKGGKGGCAVVAERCGGSSRGSLFQLLRAARSGDDPTLPATFTWARRLRLAAGAAAGVTALADRGALRTLRPALSSAHILITPFFEAKLAPFGLYEMMGVSNLPATPTAWLPPEALVPSASLALGPSAVAYSLGVVLWELLLWEEPPWEGIHGSATAVPARRPSATVRRDRLPGPLPEAQGTYDAYMGLMDRCLDTKIEQRPGLEKICEELRALAAAEEAAGKKEQKMNGEWDSEMCIICCRRQRNVVLAHVEEGQAHRCCCAECALRLKRRGDACPLCRRDFQIFRVFDA